MRSKETVRGMVKPKYWCLIEFQNIDIRVAY